MTEKGMKDNLKRLFITNPKREKYNQLYIFYYILIYIS